MSGSPRCASSAPSRNRTIAWTIDCGWTATSIRSYGTPNRKWASITSSPLFISVAESIVILAPIDQVGWASAWSGVTAARSAAERPRNGPPEAVITSDSTVSGRGVAEALPERRMLAVDRQDRAVRALGRGRHQRPAGDQALLVGQGQVGAGLERRQGRGQPGRADDRVQHRVGAGVAHQLHHAGLALQHRTVEDRAGAGGGGRVDQRDPIDAVGGRRRDQRLGVGVRCERAGGQLGVVAHDLERLDADRAGRAENGDRLHPPHSTGGY